MHFSSGPGWHDPALSRLWRYHLHYFDYVQDLLVWAASGDAESAYQAFRSLSVSWIHSNRIIRGDGWHPYTISLRLVNWLHALSYFEEQMRDDQGYRQQFIGSLYGQARILAGDLETDVRGNHLLENLRALLTAGSSFEGNEPQSWVHKAWKILEQELEEQILADGGHFERCPGYHVRVLKILLEMSVWLARNGTNTPQWLAEKQRPMLDYLRAVVPPSGELPLLKDTAWDTGPSPNDLLAAAALYLKQPAYKSNNHFGLYPLLIFGSSGWEQFRKWPPNESPGEPAALGASSHYVLRDDTRGDYLILDAGKPCPDYLPAHAHADLLTYELAAGGQRIVVDSGVYEYASGPWRDYFRSTRAHNTVEVCGVDQSEVWGSFRVARRARPTKAFWLQKDGYILLQGGHDGYRRLPVPVTHRRTILWRQNDFWLIVDELWGNGVTTAASHIHLHPDLALEPRSDSSWRIIGSRVQVWVAGFSHDKFTVIRGQVEPLRQGWYSERFGEMRQNTVLALHREGHLPFCFGYALSKGSPAKEISVESADADGLSVIYGDRKLRLRRNAEPVLE